MLGVCNVHIKTLVICICMFGSCVVTISCLYHLPSGQSLLDSGVPNVHIKDLGTYLSVVLFSYSCINLLIWLAEI